jgi:hypothetical protein
VYLGKVDTKEPAVVANGAKVIPGSESDIISNAEDGKCDDGEYFRRLEVATRLAREEELRQRREESERPKQEALEAEKQAALNEARRRMQEKSQQERVRVTAFLEAHGFADVLSKRKRFMSYSYPLHKAVEENNPEMVSLLLRAGAEKSQKNSSGQTPEVMAQKRDKKGSHEQVLAVLKLPISYQHHVTMH